MASPRGVFIPQSHIVSTRPLSAAFNSPSAKRRRKSHQEIRFPGGFAVFFSTTSLRFLGSLAGREAVRSFFQMYKQLRKKGRSDKEPRHVRLYHVMMKTAAWKSLSANARAIYALRAA